MGIAEGCGDISGVDLRLILVLESDYAMLDSPLLFAACGRYEVQGSKQSTFIGLSIRQLTNFLLSSAALPYCNPDDDLEAPQKKRNTPQLLLQISRPSSTFSLLGSFRNHSATVLACAARASSSTRHSTSIPPSRDCQSGREAHLGSSGRRTNATSSEDGRVCL